MLYSRNGGQPSNMRCQHAALHVQVCGVFALFLSGAHNFIWWGLYCYPRVQTIAVVAYFFTAGVCILVGLTAKNNAKRASPMLVLLLLRFFVVLARLLLNSGSWWASINFLWMEVCSPRDLRNHHVFLLNSTSSCAAITTSLGTVSCAA